MNDLQIFKNEEFGEIRTIEIDGEIWFVGKDVAAALGYQAERNAIAAHVDEDDKMMHRISASGQNRDMTIINESGLYSLILSSGLENAKKFKKWITSEVIPSIRKNGGYLANQENMTPEQIVANALVVAQNIIANKDKQIEEMTPKADYFDALVDRKLNTSIRDTAKELGIGERYFVQFLKDQRYIYRDQKKELRPYSDKNKGLFVLKEYKSQHSEHAGLQMLITPKGRETFRLLICGEE
ncbi:MAG: phage antirepressor KilAC domain-containing protein [Oscillospiraceae bacterium]|nr:phage antirepressor KilAC domain-containing protein [Oscillospiraceae bacterium]